MKKPISWRVGDLVIVREDEPGTFVAQITDVPGPTFDAIMTSGWDVEARHVVVRRISDGETLKIVKHQIEGRADVVAAAGAVGKTPFSMRFRHRTLGEHVHVDVFVGPPGATLANAGKLVMRAGEWTSFQLAMTALSSVLPAFDAGFSEVE